MTTLSEPIRSPGARPVFWKVGRARLLGTTALAGLLTAVLAAPVRADSSWTGAVSSDWFNAGNWSNGVPVANDTVSIQNNNVPNAVVVGATGAIAGRVAIGESANGSLTTGTEMLSGTLSYQGNTTVNGGTLHLTLEWWCHGLSERGGSRMLQGVVA